jgi:flavin-dependent dehydrogenase
LMTDGSPVGPMHGWAGVAGFVRQAWGPGWALVGDAGYYKDPITTHGMTDALRDAEVLTDALTGTEPRGPALATYQVTRDRLSGALADATDRVASYAWTLDEVRVLLRQVSAAMRAEVEYLESPKPKHFLV